MAGLPTSELALAKKKIVTSDTNIAPKSLAYYKRGGWRVYKLPKFSTEGACAFHKERSLLLGFPKAEHLYDRA